MKKRKMIALIKEIRHSVQHGAPHDLDFKPTAKLSKAEVERLQESLNQSFENWRQSWILPQLEHLQAYIESTMKKKGVK